MARTYVFRLTSEGVRELESSLKSLGESGERAFSEMAKRVPGLEGALNSANNAVDKHRERHNRMTDQVSAGLNSLVARYLSVGAAIRTVTQVMGDLEAMGGETSASLERLTSTYDKFLRTVDKPIGKAIGVISDTTDKIDDLWRALSERDWAKAWERALQPSVSNLPRGAELPYIQGYLRDAGKNGGRQMMGESPLLPSFPLPTMAEVDKSLAAARAAADKSALAISEGIVKHYYEAQQKIAEAETKRIEEVGKKEADALKEALAYGDQLRKQYADEQSKRIEAANKEEEDALKAALAYGDQLREFYANEQSKRIEAANKKEEDELEAALRYGDELRAEYARDQADRLDEQSQQAKDAAKDAAGRVTDYWRGQLDSMTNDGRNFFAHFFETGEADLRDFLSIFKRAWSQLLADLVTQRFVAPMMQSALGAMGGGIGGLGGIGGGGGGGLAAGAGLLGVGSWLGGSKASLDASGNYIPGAGGFGGGGAFGYQGFSAGGMAGGALGGVGIGSLATGLLGGNQTGGAIGGLVGGAIGSVFGPVGTMVGGALGGVVGGMFGGKPSNYRATATFAPGGGFSLSGDKPNETTTGLAQQAAAAIQAEVAQLRAFGIEFQKELSNIWIGQRDASSFQLVGGGRVGVGTVGDPADLARDAVNALLQGATSSDPVVAAQLSRGYASVDQLRQALTFATGIGAALKEITDPLGYAIELWKKESQARLDMASATGVSLEKVQQLNAALWNQQFGQINAGLITSIGGYLQTLHYGQGSSASPQQQYGAALAEYERSKQAAMTGGAPEAQRYLEMTQTFLPIAREYLGTTQAYSALQSGAESTLQGLVSKLQAPIMPDLVGPLVSATTNTGAATVEAVETVALKVDSLRESVDRLFGEFGSLMRQVSAT